MQWGTDESASTVTSSACDSVIFNVAVSEVDHQDLWQRACLAVVTVSSAQQHADRELAAVADEIERVEPGLIARTEVEFLT